MVWRIEFDPRAIKELSKFDRPIQQLILKVLRDRIATLDDPRSIGEALRGKEPGRFWKYRIDAYRVICDIRDEDIVILVIRISSYDWKILAALSGPELGGKYLRGDNTQGSSGMP